MRHTNEKEDKKEQRKTAAIIILLLLLLLTVVGCVVGFLRFKANMPKPDGTIVIQDAEENVKDENPLKGLYVTYSGITDTDISKDSTVVLTNLEENGDRVEILMMFEVYEGKDLIYSSDYIKPGTHISWEAGKVLSKGNHTLLIKQIPKVEIDGKYIPLTSGTCECTLTRH